MIRIGRSGDRRSGQTVPLLLLLAIAACGGRAEHQVLRGYFDTCAAADDVALANAALVVLDPGRDGIVGRFRVVDVGPPILQPAAASSRAVALSLFDPSNPRDPSGAVLVSKDVEVRADIHLRGTAREQPMTVTLARAESGGIVGRWVVVRLVLDGRTLPEASSGRRSGTSP